MKYPTGKADDSASRRNERSGICVKKSVTSMLHIAQEKNAVMGAIIGATLEVSDRCREVATCYRDNSPRFV